MRTNTAVMLVFFLLILAAAPWIVSSCSPRPLLPDEIRQERIHYTETVNAARIATAAWERGQSSNIKVIPLRTLSVGAEDSATPIIISETPMSPSPSPIPTPSNPVEEVRTPTPSETALQPTEEAGSKITVRTAIVTQSSEVTSTVIIIRSSTTPHSPEIPPTTSNSASTSPVPTQRLVDIQDVITEEMLTAQVKRDTDDASISDLQIFLTSDGVIATGKVSITLGIKRPIEVRGMFAVENESLVVKVKSVLLDGIDVTEQHRAQLEDDISWGLYQLLPQRYVRSYELSDGQIAIHSQVRP